MINNEFYPTPHSLAVKMWDKFTTHPEVLLEPQAGRGDLLTSFKRQGMSIDVVEVDLDNAAILRDKGYTVVGHNFLRFSTPKQYTHIIMNPPFSEGAKHVMHAWDRVLRSGQLVAVINAQSIKNPCDKYRKRLVTLLDQDGNDCEFVDAAFTANDTQRTTSVEVALISLTKTHDVSTDYSFLDNLTVDDIPPEPTPVDDPTAQQLAIPQSVISRAVTIYNAATRSLRREVDITSRLSHTTRYYLDNLDEALTTNKEADHELYQRKRERQSQHESFTATSYNKRLDDIKGAAWSTILKRTKVGKSLSSTVMKELTAKFNEIKALEFTEANILGFLQGLTAQSSDMQLQMMSHVHRTFLCYSHQNQIYYRGWKSNDRHRVAFRIKTTRIILPLQRTIMGSVSWDQYELFSDIDKVMDLLAGYHETSNSLSECIRANEKSTQERFSSKYFDIRMYSGSIHLYPNNPTLIERLNLFVGRYHNWIPPETSAPSEDSDFWKQYQGAEKYQSALRKSTTSKRLNVRWLATPPVHDDHCTELDTFNQALREAGESKGFKMDFNSLEHSGQKQLAIA